LFEAVEFVDLKDRPGAPVKQNALGTFSDEEMAVEAARSAQKTFLESGREDYAWWIVRQPGARLARWIADNHTGKEYVLDLTSGELVEVE
jgi:hypothetical protein